MRFAGKFAVVTGAEWGIGKATGLKLAGEGAHVFAADSDEAGGRALAEQSNGKISFVRCDVTLPADIEALMDAAAAKAGGIDIVFNNAAAGGDRAPIDAKIGSASCRERVCQYVQMSVVAVSLKKKQQ